MNPSKILTACILCMTALAACNREQDRQQPPEPKASAPPSAVPAASAAAAPSQPLAEAKSGASAQLKPASGSQVSGTVHFTGMDDGLRIMVEVRGLTPGKHGFHIHQKGDCSAADAMSAGDHFNPGNQAHGGHDSDMRHAGDLGNLDAGADGRASMERTVRGLALSGPDSIVGKAVLVHAGEDDLKTPPSGNSGARIACGVIEAS